MEEWFRNETVQVVLIMLSGLTAFFLFLAAVVHVLNLFPDDMAPSAVRSGFNNSDENREQRFNRLTQRPSRQAAALLDMITGQPLQACYSILRMRAASGRSMLLTVNPQTAAIVQTDGLRKLDASLRQLISQLRLSGQQISVVSDDRKLIFSPESWYRELTGAVLDRGTPMPNLELGSGPVVLQLPSPAPLDQLDEDDALLPHWMRTRLPPLLPPAVDDSLPGQADDSDCESFEDYELELSANPTVAEVDELFAKYLEFSDGVDEERSILLKGGVPVGYPSIVYEQLAVVPLTESERIELFDEVTVTPMS
ncbi:MAG: hypothetical protein V1738_01850 [Patescibacteria group bacterium]